MKRAILLLLMVINLSSFNSGSSLKGVWEFRGGIYNGKKEGAPDGYKLQRKYSETQYEAFILEKVAKPFNYEKGNYQLKGDTCIDTETFNSESSKLTGIPIHYLYAISHDTLTLSGTLPTGMQVQEYWKKVK